MTTTITVANTSMIDSVTTTESYYCAADDYYNYCNLLLLLLLPLPLFLAVVRRGLLPRHPSL